jgi:hypothetical protein
MQLRTGIVPTRINIQSAEPTRLTPTDTILLWAPERLANFLEGIIAREANIPERTVAHQREFTTISHTPPPISRRTCLLGLYFRLAPRQDIVTRVAGVAHVLSGCLGAHDRARVYSLRLASLKWVLDSGLSARTDVLSCPFTLVLTEPARPRELI